ncbi:hypothetical protein V6N12_069653 [Hibiscus sabdariffa]|uniref:Uncharacterized protein n=1 Tax=Hibiscus sabdariffa TaxID=183260 RepID=A0ABR2FEG6_9ROSI
MVGLPVILERPSDPVTAEDECLAKRVKNHADSEVEDLDQVGVEVMEADGVDGSVGQLDPSVTDAPDQQGHRFSYASVVAKDPVRHGKSREEPLLSPDEVVVLDEDCIINESSDFPTIKFSYRVHDQIDHKACVAAIPGSPTRVKDTSDQDQFTSSTSRSSSLHGPWIVSLIRRRQTAPSAPKEGRNGVGHIGMSLKGGSRFHVLQDVGLDDSVKEGPVEAMVTDDPNRVIQGGESSKASPMQASTALAPVRKNAAYLASNPERRSKKGPVAINVKPVMDVVTLVEGGSSEVCVRKVDSSTGNQRALSILESDAEGKSVARSRTGNGLGVLAEWVQSATNRIDSLVNTVHLIPSHNGMEMEVVVTSGPKPVSGGRDPVVVVGDSIDMVVHDGGGNPSS